MVRIRSEAFIAVSLGLVVALAGCGTPKSPVPRVNTSPTVGEGAATEPANPVPIVKKIKGCVLDEGTEVGEHDVWGNRFASCSFMDNGLTDENGNAKGGNGKSEPGTSGTGVTARTYPGDPRQLETNPQFLKSDDGTKRIIGKDFVVTITGIWTAYSKHLGPKEIEEIARQVGGEYIPSR